MPGGVSPGVRRVTPPLFSLSTTFINAAGQADMFRPAAGHFDSRCRCGLIRPGRRTAPRVELLLRQAVQCKYRRNEVPSCNNQKSSGVFLTSPGTWKRSERKASGGRSAGVSSVLKTWPANRRPRIVARSAGRAGSPGFDRWRLSEAAHRRHSGWRRNPGGHSTLRPNGSGA